MFIKSLTLLTLAVCASANAQYTVEILPTPNGGGRATGAGGGQIVGSAFGPGGGPALWNAPAYQYTNMMPGAFNAAELLGVGGGKQVGYGRVTAGRDHAMMWSGSANDYVDLDVSTFVTGTAAWATDGVSQVGVGGYEQNRGHALLWYGTAQSVVDLHPQGYVHSHAYGVWGDVQIGNLADFSLPEGPVMWRGTAESMTFLPLPKGYTNGFAYAIHGDQIVGNAGLPTGAVAVIWNAKTLSFTDLGAGVGHDTNGVHQVGYSAGRAKMWAGTAQSALDLHQFLPVGFTESRALGIDENGVIVGWASGGQIVVPVAWTPIPEPATIAALGIGVLALCFRRRFRRR